MGDPRGIFLINGIFAVMLAAAMLIPAAVDLMAGNTDYQVFLAAASASGFVGGTVVACTWRRGIRLTLRGPSC